MNLALARFSTILDFLLDVFEIVYVSCLYAHALFFALKCTCIKSAHFL